MTTDDRLPIIAGAGPVGLAATLFLRRHGVAVRLIDAAAERPPYSRALVVNPRTLDLLAPTGVAERIRSIGLVVRGATFWSGGRPLFDVSFDEVRQGQPYLIALSQAVTEQLLHEALVTAGGAVERPVSLVDCRPAGDVVEVTLGDGDPLARATERVPWLLAADGSHSAARHAIGVDFPGDTRAIPWTLADAPLATSLAQDRAHIVLLDGGGFLFTLRVVTNATTTGDPLWRVMGNVPDPLERLQRSNIGATPSGPAVWTSTFRIAHRVARPFSVGRIYLAGDAAHVHSPVGARGMNLGIEDAWTFAELVAAGRVDAYGRIRRRVDRRVVQRIRAITRMACGESAITRLLRAHVTPKLLRVGVVRQQLLQTLSGLDHALEL